MDAISEDTVRKVLHTVLETPGTSLSIDRIAEGGDHAAWYIGEDMILRLQLLDQPEPNSSNGANLRIPEVEIRRLLHDHYINQSFPSIIPECLGFHPCLRVDAQRLISCTLDKRVRGISLEHANAVVTQETIEDLARLLRVTKEVPLRALEGLHLPRPANADLDRLLHDTRHAWERLWGNEQLDSYYLADGGSPSAFFENNVTPPLKISGQPEVDILLHYDFKGEHIFINPEDGRVLGVIDWSDAAIGDPAVDINGLAISVGAPSAIMIGRLAGYDDTVARRGVFLARCETILRLDDRLNGDDYDSPESLLRVQMRRAFESIPIAN